MGLIDDFRNAIRIEGNRTAGGPLPAPDHAAIAARTRQEQLIKDQEDQLKKFDENQGAMKQRAVAGGDRAVRQALENRMRGIKNDASRRGLLYSGVKDASEANAKVGAQKAFSNQRQSVNTAFMSAREKMQNLLDKLKFNQMEESVIMADSLYDQALVAAEEDRGLISGLMSAAGTGAGMYAASQGSQGSTAQDNQVRFDQNSRYLSRNPDL